MPFQRHPAPTTNTPGARPSREAPPTLSERHQPNVDQAATPEAIVPPEPPPKPPISNNDPTRGLTTTSKVAWWLLSALALALVIALAFGAVAMFVRR